MTEPENVETTQSVDEPVENPDELAAVDEEITDPDDDVPAGDDQPGEEPPAEMPQEG